jgi:3-methyladenine DNA glycosylase AlkD
MLYIEVIQKLRSLSNRRNREGMSRFGINTKKAFGISVVDLRKIAKKIGKDHSLALKLWRSGYHEARILAAMIDDPEVVTEKQMNSWVKDFNSWDLCDQCCGNLFDKTPFAYKYARVWSRSKHEFVKRAGYVMIATLAVHDKDSDDSQFRGFFPLIIRGSVDERNFVKKAVNWALRQIGKRNHALNQSAVKIANEIYKIDSRSAKWVASDAIRELTSKQVQSRLK